LRGNYLRVEQEKSLTDTRTILVADDDASVLKVLRELFQMHGCRVISASNGSEAVDAAKRDGIDVAVLDMRMPRMSGLEALKEIKIIDPTIEVLIITGYTDVTNFREAIFNEGASDYILKPFRIQDLLRAVEDSLRKRDALLNHDARRHAFQEVETHAERSFAERKVELRESQLKYKQIIESSNEAIAVVQKGKFSFVNPKVMVMTGFTREEILESRAMDLIFRADRGMLTQFCRRISRTNGEVLPSTCTFRVSKKNGELIWVEMSAVSTIWEGSLATMGFGRDITERKEAEEVLLKAHEELEIKVQERTAELLEANAKLKKEVEERKQAEKQIERSKTILQGVFDGISDPLIMLDRQMTIKALNKAASVYFNVSYKDAVDKSYGQLFSVKRGKGNPCDVTEAVKNGQSTVFEREGQKDPDRLERVFVYPLENGKGKNTGVLIRINDITEEKMMEKQLVQSEKLASLGLLVSGIAHEINNPNNFIFFNIPILKSYLQEVFPIIEAHAETQPDYEVMGMAFHEFREDLWKLLDNMEHGATRINTTVTSLREFSRLKKQESKLWVNLMQLVENTVAICQGQINKMVKSFEVELPPALPLLYLEPGALEQVLINLLINAAQAANKKRSWIKLKIEWMESAPDLLVVEVSDNGCGMDKETQKHIFDPFFTTKSPGAGTGLGLYICHNLIESLGGAIEVESVPRRGSKFRIILRNLRIDGRTMHAG
jgi:PAS domain S-box-containing protein